MADKTLKLHVEKGPREGQALEFKPGSSVGIGRVVRGNNLTLKDAGISSKHLTIHFDTASDSWLITDLDSSNGTIVIRGNSSKKLPPNDPFVLLNGDFIKIGEYSSIRVEIGAIDIVVVDEEEKEELRLRRNHRRRVNGKEKVEDRNVETRARKKTRSDNASGEVEDIGNGLIGERKEKGRRRGRPRLGVKCEVVEEEEGDCNFSVVLNAVGKKGDKTETRGPSPRKTRARKREENLATSSKNEGVVEKGAVECGDKKSKGRRTQRGLRKVENFQEGKNGTCLGRLEEEMDDDIIDSKENVKRIDFVRVMNGPDLVDQVGVNRMESFGRSADVDIDTHEARIELENEGDAIGIDEIGRGGENLDVTEDVEKVNSLPDLAKMTLRDWFDFMEVYLPKQIIEESGKLIAEMRSKAQRVRCYVAEQKAHG